VWVAVQDTVCVALCVVRRVHEDTCLLLQCVLQYMLQYVVQYVMQYVFKYVLQCVWCAGPTNTLSGQTHMYY